MPSTRSRTIVAVGLVIALSITGALVVTALDIDLVASEPDADELVATVIDEYTDVETVRATRVYEYEIHDTLVDDPRTGETVAEIWKRPPDQFRKEIVATSQPGRTVGDVLVVNGSTLRAYNAGPETMLVDDEWPDGEVDHRPELYDADFETEYVGTDTVDGRETHVVEIQPAENETSAVSLLVGGTEYTIPIGDDETDGNNATSTTTWWIDVEEEILIKERLEIEYDDPESNALRRERDVRTVTYENLRFDEPISDDRFTLEPPAGTEVYGPSEPFAVDTVEEADEVAPFPVQEPDVPDRFEFISVSGREFRGNATVELLYRDGDVIDGDVIRVRVSEAPFDSSHTDVHEEDVGEHGGSLVTTGMGPGYTWECDGVYHEVVARNGDGGRDLALELAESIDCSENR